MWLSFLSEKDEFISYKMICVFWRSTKDLLVPGNDAKNLIGKNVCYIKYVCIYAQVQASPQVI